MFASRKPGTEWVAIKAGQGGQWSQASLTFDGVYHDLDISAYIPVGTKFVLLVGLLRDNATGAYIELRNNDTTKNQMYYHNVVVVSNITQGYTVVIGVSPTRKIDYRGMSGVDIFTMTIVAYAR